MVNSIKFLSDGTGAEFLPAVAAPATIATANMLEALVGGYAMRRLVKDEPLANPRTTMIFLGLVVALPATVSAGIGTTAIWAFDTTDAAPSDIFVTWYFANATGALIVVPSVLWLLRRDRLRSPPIRPGEFIATLLLLVVLLEALVGAGVVKVLAGWPSAYMIWPALILVCFRYGERELILVLVLTMSMAVAGTMRGFAAFPAETEWQRALINWDDDEVLKASTALKSDEPIWMMRRAGLLATLFRHRDTARLSPPEASLSPAWRGGRGRRAIALPPLRAAAGFRGSPRQRPSGRFRRISQCRAARAAR